MNSILTLNVFSAFCKRKIFQYNIKYSLQMFDKNLNSFSQLPIKEKDRKCTDCFCTFIGGAFALTLFVLAFVFMNKDNYYKSNFPTDSDNRPCSYGVNSQFAYVYFPDVNDPSSRVCVSSCPKSSSLDIECNPNSKVPSCLSVHIYETSEQFQRLGGFCAPVDQAHRELLIKNTNMSGKWGFLNYYDIIRLSLVFSLLLGIIWMSMVQCLPRHIVIAAMLIASNLLIAFGVILIIDNDAGWNGSFWRLVIASLMIVFGIFFLAMVVLYRRRVKISGVLLNYSTNFLSQQPANFLYIPMFLILSVGLIVLCLFQYLCYSSQSDPEVVQGDIFLHLKRNVPLTVLTIIELIWGMQFLKDTFNFFVSGNSAEWYIKGSKSSNCCLPVGRFFKYNFGSVVGGSFLNAFFNFIDFIFESLRCYPGGCCGVCAPICSVFDNCCGCFFDLIRNDAYAYINLTGIPYCNAARNCETLCSSNKIFIGNQSVIFFYRLCAHIVCIGAVCLMSYWLMKSKVGILSVSSLFLIAIFAYMICTYFIDIHADAAQGLQVAYLMQLELNGGDPEAIAPARFQGLKGEMKSLKNSYIDGSC